MGKGRSSRPVQTAWVPPHRRDIGQQVPRSLDDLHPVFLEVQLISRVGQSPWLDCPWELVFTECVESSSGQRPCQVAKLQLPNSGEESMQELLDWFQERTTASDAGTRATLQVALPATLTKQERAQWHKYAESLSLHSESRGLAHNRRLFVTAAPAASGLSPAVHHAAKDIWDLCQLEGGRLWTFSQNEIAQMLQSDDLDHGIQAMQQRRLQAKLLLQHLQEKDEEAALQVIDSLPSVAWVKDPATGGYAFHVACWQGLAAVVRRLAGIPGTLQQQDGRWRTPLRVAQQRGFAHLVDILEAAAAGQSASETCSRVTALPPAGRGFERGKVAQAPPGLGPAPSAGQQAGSAEAAKHSMPPPVPVSAGPVAGSGGGRGKSMSNQGRHD